MRVAIIGAGLSGLSCANRLRQLGIAPTVFEKRNQIGDALCNACINLRLFSRVAGNPFTYLKKQYDLEVEPLAPLKKIIMKSENKTCHIRGHLGDIMKRGPESYSLENQIAAKANAPIVFDRYIEYEEIKDEYDHIVVATGSNLIAKQLGVWTETFIAQVRYGVVLGKFDTSTIMIWFNTSYAKNAFAYLIPSSQKEASLVLIVNGITYSEIDFYWNRFLAMESIDYHLVETKDVEHYCGFVDPLEKDGTFFVGNTAGFTDDFLGVGGINAIESGILAADAIAMNLDYKQLARPIFENIVKLHEYRKAINRLDNDDYDRIMTIVGVPVLKQFIYNNPFARAVQGAFLAKTFNHLK